MQQEQQKSMISYSHISTFEKCPLQYRFRYIERIPVPPSKHLSFGNALHSAVEEFQKMVADGILDIYSDEATSVVLKLLDKNWKSEGFESAEEEKAWMAKARRALIEYFVPWARQQLQDEYRILAVEDWFSIDLGKCILRGKIDRIDFRIVEDTVYYRIVDFKTGEKVPYKNQNSEDTQLYVYTFGAEQILNNRLPPNFTENRNYVLEKIMYFYMIPNNEVENRIDEAHKNMILAKINLQIDNLLYALELNSFPARTGRHCDYCDFKHLCPEFSGIKVAGGYFGQTNDEDKLRKLIEEYQELVEKIKEKEREIFDFMRERGIAEFEYNGTLYRINQES